MSMHRLSGCPSCAEPLEEGDRFCGLCGYALTTRPAGATAPGAPAHPAAAPSSAPIAGAGRIPAGPTTAGGGAAPAEGADTRSSGAAYAGASAPGWGSASTAAPTLVAGPTGWSDPTAPAGSRSTAPGPGTPYSAPTPQGQDPAVEAAYGGQLAQGPADGYGSPGPGDRARYDHPTPQGHYPEGEAPYGGPAQQDPMPGHEAPYGGLAPQGQYIDGEAAYGGAAQQDPTPGHEAPFGGAGQGDPYGGGEPQGEGSGKTCVACRAGRVDTDGYCEHCGHAQPRERDHIEEELGSVAAVTDRGLRHHRNEDSFAVAATALPDGSAATVAIVCDGVSSASRPDEASAAAAGAANEALLEALPRGAHPQEAMHEAILAAAAAVNALAPEVPGAQNAPACTLVGAVVSSGLLTIGWVGDSRAYWVPDDRAALPRRLTEDDSWAAQMVAAGLMGEAEAYADVRAHAITGWLGADAYDLEPHTATFKPDHDGVVVVCTDGLWNYAESARDLAQVLPADAAVRPLHSAQVLVGHALDGGGHDNVTVAVVPFAATPPTPPAPPVPQTQA
ncbi:protein phosphatase 2C domain-containing protein [Streptomyces sp. NBC_00435]|uniref:protein phosphatase 2C domain-containing protein n=1 Tax=Streptomyces sp. NBC_00435 TaxID=2903649 RepID=UPI002E1A299D